MHAIFGGGAALLEFHIAVGAVWSAGFLIYGFVRFKRITLPFIKEMLTFSPGTDIEWLLKKILSMTLGTRMMQRFGLKPVIPDQGFYNVGQKMFGITALFGGVVIAVTGWIMTYSQQDLTSQGTVQWAILIHFLVPWGSYLPVFWFTYTWQSLPRDKRLPFFPCLREKSLPITRPPIINDGLTRCRLYP